MTATATASYPASSAGHASIPYMLLMNVVFILYSLSFVTKEKIFEDSRKRLGGVNLDIFVVNTFGSCAQVQPSFILSDTHLSVFPCLYQVLCTFCLFPFILKARNMVIQDLPQYFLQGASCFCGTSLSTSSDCTGMYTVRCADRRHECSLGAPLLPLCYIAANLTYNVSGLYLVRSVGALVTSLVSSLVVPVTIAVFILPIPYLVLSHERQRLVDWVFRFQVALLA